LRLKNRPLDNRRRDERQKKQPQIHRLKKEIENTNCTNLHELKNRLKDNRLLKFRIIRAIRGKKPLRTLRLKNRPLDNRRRYERQKNNRRFTD